LGPSWGTKLFQKFFDAIFNPFQDGHFTTTKLVDAIHSTQETFKTIFPDAFSSDLDQSVSEMWVAIESFKAAVTASIPVRLLVPRLGLAYSRRREMPSLFRLDWLVLGSLYYCFG